MPGISPSERTKDHGNISPNDMSLRAIATKLSNADASIKKVVDNLVLEPHSRGDIKYNLNFLKGAVECSDIKTIENMNAIKTLADSVYKSRRTGVIGMIQNLFDKWFGTTVKSEYKSVMSEIESKKRSINHEMAREQSKVEDSRAAFKVNIQSIQTRDLSAIEKAEKFMKLGHEIELSAKKTPQVDEQWQLYKLASEVYLAAAVRYQGHETAQSSITFTGGNGELRNKKIAAAQAALRTFRLSNSQDLKAFEEQINRFTR